MRKIHENFSCAYQEVVLYYFKGKPEKRLPSIICNSTVINGTPSLSQVVCGLFGLSIIKDCITQSDKGNEDHAEMEKISISNIVHFLALLSFVWRVYPL